MIVPRSALIGSSISTSQTARSRFGVCPSSTSSELYLDDISVGTCSGFLLTSGLFATAGTCVLDNNLVSQCNNLAVVFNFATTAPGFTRTTFGSSEIFYCQSVVAAYRPQTIVTVVNATTGVTRTDYIARPNYAVIQLDRSVGLFGINSYNYFRSLKNLHVNEKVCRRLLLLLLLLTFSIAFTHAHDSLLAAADLHRRSPARPLAQVRRRRSHLGHRRRNHRPRHQDLHQLGHLCRQRGLAHLRRRWSHHRHARLGCR